ncbi:MAG: hypothetical protein ACYDGN_12210 [Acidimicrobiales bacterium]
MSLYLAEVLADPLGIAVDLICETDPALDRLGVEELVKTVAPGRSVRRRLAQALVDRPSVLTDGRSPAPRVVGELLVALGTLTGSGISPPRCAGCNRSLRSFQRRGVDWYCSSCGPKRLACAGCGAVGLVAARDRAGEPRCGSCLPGDERDPTEILFEVITAIDSSIDADTITSALDRATSRRGHRRRLAWALEDHPQLLTGAGAEAPVPSVLRLIDALCDAGSERIVRPVCPKCHRAVTLSKLRDGLRICRGCEARLRAVACARCGAVRDPVTREASGGPVCANCFTKDPSNQEECRRCGRRRPVSVRTSKGPLCASCRPVPQMTCAICGRVAPCEIAKATGQPWCRACQQRSARCAGCGAVRQVRGGSPGGPLCATCTRVDRSFWKACPNCGELTKLTDGPCIRCALRQRLNELLTVPGGTVRPEFQCLFENLVGVERPRTVLDWLSTSEAATVLGELGQGRRTLSHEALDQLPAAKPVEHLRAVLVATRALPRRDEQMARLERWVTSAVEARSDPEKRQILQHYGIWHLLRRLRRRAQGIEITHMQATGVKQHVRAAIGLLDWLDRRDLTLASAHQGDLEEWLTSTELAYRREAGHFIRWAATEKLTTLELPAVRWGGPVGPMDSEARWAKARVLLGDSTIDLGDRVAGLLVLFYAQTAAAISRLTLTHVETDDLAVRLRLGPEPIVLPSPLDGLVLGLVASRRGHAVLGDQGTSPWLFPGGQPGRPISASRLAERLRRIGLKAGPARSTALFGLASELPAAVLARMLGIHISVAVQWQQASNGDWGRYAADVGRRTDL